MSKSAERRALAKEMLDIRRTLEPHKFFLPNLSQRPVLESPVMEKWIFGGNGLGKTAMDCIIAVMHMTGDYASWFPANLRCRPDVPSHGAMSTTTFTNAIEKGLIDEFSNWCPGGMGNAQHRRFKWDSRRKRVTDKVTGSVLDFFSYDQDPRDWAGPTKDYWLWDEHGTFKHYQEAKRSLRGNPGHFFGTLTPTEGMCFDDETEILTRRGWKGYDSISGDDEILTINQETKRAEWKRINNLYINRDTKRFIHLKQRDFDAMITPRHRWLVENRGKWTLKPVEQLRKFDRIPRALPMASHPTVPFYSDDFVRLVGWCITEGAYRKGNRTGINIGLSKNRYPESCREVENTLESLSAHYREYEYEQASGTTEARFALSGTVASSVRAVTPKKVPTYDFLFSLTEAQKELLFDTIILGDGSVYPGGWKIAEPNPELVDFYHALAISLGRKCRSVWEKNVYRLWVSDKSERYEPFTNFGNLKKSTILTDSAVSWCVNTDNETLYAKRNGTVYISGNTWEFEIIYEQADGIQLQVFRGRTRDNEKNLRPGYMDDLIRGLSKEEAQMRLFGDFIELSGLMYPEFDSTPVTGHICDEFDVNSEEAGSCPKLLVIDPGYRNPCAALWLTVDKDGQLYFYREYYEEKFTVQENARRIVELTPEGEPIQYVLIDPAGHDMSSHNTVMEQFEEAFMELKRLWPLYPANKDVDAGIAAVRTRLKEHTIHFFPGLSNTVKEFRRYVHQSQRYKSITEKNKKEKPKEYMDHLMDCVRYAVMDDPVYYEVGTTKAEGLEIGVLNSRTGY